MRYARVFIACFVLLGTAISAGCAPSKEISTNAAMSGSTRAQEFTNVSIEAGLSGYRGDNLAWGDYNNDGYLDLLVRGPSSNYLFRNQGDGTFTEVSNETGVNITRGYSQWADYNGDGYLDFYTAGNDDHLFRNNGPPSWDFTDVTFQAGDPSDGLPTEGIAWGDYDRDGYPDIYTVGWRKPGDLQWPYAGEMDRLYHNNGDGTFTDVSISAGLLPRSTSFAGMGVVWCDPNEDGWPDIYVSNYHLNPNHLWMNNRDGTFTDMAFQYNLTGKITEYEGNTYYGHSNGAGWADYDNDQDMDVWVSHLAHKDDERSGMNRGYYCADSQLFNNQGPEKFTFKDRRIEAGIPITPSGTVVQDPDTGDYMWKDEDYFGVAWGDCDNDGDLDLWVPQVKTYSFWDHSFLWEIDGDGSFIDSTVSSGLKVWSNTGGTWVDYDNDGDLDFCTEGSYPFRGPRELHLFDNPGTSGHWLELDLKGAGGQHQTSTDATGSKVVAVCGGDVYTRYVGGDCGGHGFQQPQRLHFGLSSHTDIDELFVYWTSGRIQRFVDVGVDQLLTINEPTTQHVEINSGTFEFDVQEDEVVSLDLDLSGAGVTSMYWNLDNDRHFEKEVSSEDIDLSFHTSGIKWLRFRVKDVYGTYWDLEPIIVDVMNTAPGISAPVELQLLEDEEFLLDLEPVDTSSDLRNLTFQWDLGDGIWIEGTSSRALNFSDRGEYIVRARVVDDDGLNDTVSTNVEVLNAPPVIALHSEDVVVEGNTLQFSVTAKDSIKDMEQLRYRFFSGDGRYSGWIRDPTMSFKYEMNGTYRAGVEVMDRHDATSTEFKDIHVYNMVPELVPEASKYDALEDEEISFSVVVADTEGDMEDMNIRWDFGDGSPRSEWSDLTAITHKFEDEGFYNVIVQAMDDNEMIGTSSLVINVSNVRPEAEITVPSITIFEDQTVSFSALLTDSDSDQDSLEHIWSVEGVDTLWSTSDPVLDHVFTTSGEHVVTLFVRDDDETVTYNETVLVTNMPPVAKLEASTRSADEDRTVTFDATSSTDTVSDRPLLEYQWSLDGSYWENGSSILRRAFQDSGSYEVHVRVLDDDGVSSQESITITIKNVVPVASLQIAGSEMEGIPVVFDASGSYDTTSDMVKLIFTFDPGDGSAPITSTESIVNHTYSLPGEYVVELTLSDGDDTVAITEVITIVEVHGDVSESGDDKVMVVVLVGVFVIMLLLAGLGAFLVLSRRAEVSPVTDSQIPPLVQQPRNGSMGMRGGTAPPLAPSGRASLPPSAPEVTQSDNGQDQT